MSFDNTSQPYYSEFIHLSRYSRWLEKEKRRETWEETVNRLTDFWVKKYPLLNEPKVGTSTTYINDLWDAIYNLEIMPSMRSLMTAGPALERDHVASNNCAYTAIQGRGNKLIIFNKEMIENGFDEPIELQLKNPTAFDEVFYILLCGTGVGFSVERQYINNLPTVGKKLNRSIYRRTSNNFPGINKEELSFYDRKTNTIQVADSKYGWASALRVLVVELYNGNFNIQWDTSKVRPAGAPLKTFGGRASGPGPLNNLFIYFISVFRNAIRRKLTSIEVHGLLCKIADIVVVGGVRRSALLSLSNFSDDRMRHAKSGNWWLENPHYALANNSIAYTEKPDAETFLREWVALVESKSGERGIFNRTAATRAVKKTNKRDATYAFGCNPCSEIILRDQQFCNLSEVIVRSEDTLEDLKRKVTFATILGTLQATLTDFKYLNPEWKKNTEEEALLGVSLTGIMDHPILGNYWGDYAEDEYYWLHKFFGYEADVWDNGQEIELCNPPEETEHFILLKSELDDEADNSQVIKYVLSELKQVAIETNKEWSKKLGINQATAITCVKPSGTVSQLVDCASGIHPRHSKYYIRSIRNDKKDPITKFMIDVEIPYEEDITNPNNEVFYFPMKATKNALIREEVSAIEQLELWKIYQDHWCEHKPSMTCSVKEHEWMEVGAWVYENFDKISGISFLPWDGGIYKQAPYQTISEEEYNEWVKKMPKEIDWAKLANYEQEDNTIGSQEYACSGGSCDLL